MFLHLSVSHSVHKGGLCPGGSLSGGVSVQGGLCQETPQTKTPRTVIRGRYASYWNAFLFPFINNLHKRVITLFMLDPHVESTDRSTNNLHFRFYYPSSHLHTGFVCILPVYLHLGQFIFKQKKAILINFTMSVVSVESDKGISRQTIACSFSHVFDMRTFNPKITKPKISWLKSTSQKGDSQPTVSNSLDGKVNAVC